MSGGCCFCFFCCHVHFPHSLSSHEVSSYGAREEERSSFSLSSSSSPSLFHHSTGSGRPGLFVLKCSRESESIFSLLLLPRRHPVIAFERNGIATQSRSLQCWRWWWRRLFALPARLPPYSLPSIVDLLSRRPRCADQAASNLLLLDLRPLHRELTVQHAGHKEPGARRR
jgi:hypothetical protein